MSQDVSSFASYLRPEDDGLLMRSSGRHVALKLDYLRRFLGAFTTSMRKKWTAMHYIDLFCGAGKCRVGDTRIVHVGSPLIALTTPYPFSRYFFVDLDANKLDALKNRCRASPLHQRVECIVEDANTAVQSIVGRIRAYDRVYDTSLNLAFLDPQAFELQWNTVVSLTSVNRMDLIIYYPENALNRAMKPSLRTPRATRVDRFFGSATWRDIYSQWQTKPRAIGIHRLLIDHYIGNLAKLGYVKQADGVPEDEPLIRNIRRGPLYRLLFASKHEFGLYLWREITRRDVYGQRRMLLDGTGTYVL